MQKTFYLVIILLYFNHLCLAQEGQIEGIVISELDAKPVPYANITQIGSFKGVQSDSNGKFIFKTTGKNIKLKATSVGFESTELQTLTNSFIVFRLKPIENNLNEITVKVPENPAWEIMRRVLKNVPQNDPTKFNKFTSEYYTKVTLKLNSLSITKKDDSVRQKRIDGDLFLVENFGNIYQKNGQRKEIVNHSISSFPKGYPIDVFINSIQNPFGFYSPILQVNLDFLGLDNTPNLRNQRFYVNPINPHTFSQYNLILKDTIIIGPDSAYNIDFQPISKKNFNGLKGNMKVNFGDYALREITAETTDSLQSLSENYFQSYERIGDKWFPINRVFTMTFTYTDKSYNGKFKLEIQNNMSNTENYFDDKAVSFDGTTRLVLPFADTISRESFEKYRPIPLTEKNKTTYSKAEKFETKKFSSVILKPGMEILKMGMSGVIPLGPINLLNNQATSNAHEKIRVGFGIQNDLLSNPRWRFYGSWGYGIADKKLKYDAAIAFHLTKDRFNKIETYYTNDIERPGLNPTLFANYYVPPRISLNLGNEEYWIDSFEKYGVAVHTKPFNWTQMRVFVEKEDRQPINYTISEQNGPLSTNKVGLSVRFAFKENFVRTGYIETIRNTFFPIIRLNVAQYFTENQTNFTKSNLLLIEQFRTKKMGKSNLQLSLGKSWGELPFPYLFNNLAVPINIWGTNSSAGFHTLSTTNLGYNKYVSVNFLHDFEQTLLKTNSKWFRPELMLGNNLAFSILNQKKPIVNGEEIGDLKNGVFEANLALRNIIIVKIFGFKVGFGANTFYNYSNNFSGKKRFNIMPLINPVFF